MNYFLRIAFVAAMGITVAIFFFQQVPKETGARQEMPNDWFYMQRAYPEGRINHAVYVEGLKQASTLRKTKKEDTYWQFEGPLNSGGRLSDVESHPDLSVVYAGTASGGVFRVSDDGTAWESIFDDALSLSIGDVAIAPSDPSILYVGTGEANCGGGSQTYDGVGIYRSDDGGDTWVLKGLEESRNIGRIAVHPLDPDIVYAAAMGSLFGDSPDRGIYKTTDGGDSWEQVLFISDSTGGIDLVMHPETPDILYAAMWERVRRPDRRSYGGITCGIFRTVDGGESWNELTNGLPSPASDIGRIGIDIASSDPDVLYAIYADDIGYFKGVYKTLDGGDSWYQTNDESLSNCFQSYGWWFGRIEADPQDPDVAYVIGFDLYKTINGGNSWDNISSEGVHVDQHGLYIHPVDNDRLYLGNDGGLYFSDDGGDSWEFFNTLPVSQFYTCEIDEQYPERLYGGTQDNGTNRTLGGGLDDWEHIYGGDGFYVLVDPLDNNFVYAEYQYGGLGRSTNGGNDFINATNGISYDDRKNWNTPVIFDPVNPMIMYYGANKLYKSVNRAVSWSAISPDLTGGPGVNLTYGTITTIAVSPVNQDILYAGTDDGHVWTSGDGGTTWEPVTEGLPDRWVTRVTADPLDENVVYLTFSGYRWNEYLPHVFRSGDMGQAWTDISANLPEIPLNDIVVDPEDNNRLYVASDAGVFTSQDLGDSWDIMGTNLPLVPVSELELHNGTRTLVAATFGRSMYSYDLYQDTVTTYIAEDPRPVWDPAVKVYPNPVSSHSLVSISLDEESTVELLVTDINGRVVRNAITRKFDRGENILGVQDLQLPSLDPGIYILVARTKKGVKGIEFIVAG